MIRWQRRYTVILLCFLALFLGYTDRVNISIAAIAMQETFGWSDTTKGLVLSSFFVGYLLFMIVGGWAANRFGGKIVLGIAVIAWSFFTLVTPWAAGISLPVLIAARILLGIGEAASSPAFFNLLGYWAPVKERARAVSLISSGATAGVLVALLVTGWLITQFGWPMAFYSFGALGFVWAIFWFAMVHPRPDLDPKISVEERELLEEVGAGAKEKLPIPWGQMLRSVPVWVLFINGFCVNWCLYVFLTWLPSYFMDTQGVSIIGAGLYAALPWVTMFVFMNAGGWIADHLLSRGMSVTTVRKLMQSIGLGGSAICVLFAGGPVSAGVALFLTCGALGLLALCYAGFAAAVIDMAPRHSDVLWSITNTLGTVPGIIGVAVTGWLVEVTNSYATAFTVTAALGAVGVIAWLTLWNTRQTIQ